MGEILGVIVGFVAFGIVWFFLLKPKKDELPTDELKIKEEEIKFIITDFNNELNMITKNSKKIVKNLINQKIKNSISVISLL